MNIWVIGRGYPTPENLMWGRFELEHSKLLAEKGHDVSFIAITLSFFNRDRFRGCKFFQEDGVDIFLYSHFYFPGKLRLYFELYEDRCWENLFKEVQKRQGLPDIIHVHYPAMICSTKAIEEYRKLGIKIVVMEHWSRVLTNDLKKHEVARIKYYMKRAACFCAVGDGLLNAVNKISDTDIPMEIIPNTVSPVFMDSREKRKELFTYLAVGRLVPLKQFDKVIEQFGLVFGNKQKFRLIIIGNGTEKKRLIRQAKEFQNIFFTGEISGEEVAAYMTEADALISFSKYETFGVPVIEAMSCGKPVIVSSTSGVSSYIKNSMGFVIDPDNYSGLREAINRIYKEYDCFDKNEIAAYAKNHFSRDAVYHKLETVYKRVMEIS